ncbi:MAG: TIGR03960 family B12-binding radical SAM protein [Oscillospiraceae bacterium]|nr:TIGR03960 family B12-binding radical SAM protein [Oscillospiraceae bacterium]
MNLLDDEKLKNMLRQVEKPARYVGGEYNQVVKDKSEVDVRFAFCFPDTYEIGMSNLGVKILYGIINEMPGVWCERVFAPWGDMAERMRREHIPIWALESGDALEEFDIIAFSLGYEMAYTTVLDVLDLGGIPLHATDRPSLDHLVMAGGACCCNIEPMADFLDLCFLGEGEDMDREVIELYRTAKREGWSKERFLHQAANIGGVYVPSLYDITYHEDGTVASITPKDGAPEKVRKRIVEDFENSYYPTRPVVPSTEIVHDRVSLEVFRGCIRGCRFCQAGQINRPVRSRSAEKLLALGRETLENTGYQELNLSSLSTSDYRELSALCDGLLDYCRPRGISLSLPSLRADNFSMDIMQRVQQVRKGGLTFAPEAGTQRLRDVINKNVTEDDLLESCRVAFSGGWNGVKLYFMLGLPTETDEDVLGIAELAQKVFWVWKKNAVNRSRGVRITVSTSEFIPKPHTPFQWEAQVSRDEYLRRVGLLSNALKQARSITYNWHDAEMSLIEAALARGDRKMGRVIEEVWRTGGRLESWSEYFSLERWLTAFKTCGMDIDFYATRERPVDELMPWEHMDNGVTRRHLEREREAAYAGRLSPDCRKSCMGCGAASLLKEGVCRG